VSLLVLEAHEDPHRELRQKWFYFPRAGLSSTGRCRTLHEPFSKYWGPDQVGFDQVARVVASTDLIKHHPGNILSTRQNRQLYADWISAGGRIVHLSRQDVRAQAKSLVIARGLNSSHGG